MHQEEKNTWGSTNGAQRAIWAWFDFANDLYLAHIWICMWPLFGFEPYLCYYVAHISEKKKTLERALMVHREQSGPDLILQRICIWPIFVFAFYLLIFVIVIGPHFRKNTWESTGGAQRAIWAWLNSAKDLTHARPGIDHLHQHCCPKIGQNWITPWWGSFAKDCSCQTILLANLQKHQWS